MLINIEPLGGCLDFLLRDTEDNIFLVRDGWLDTSHLLDTVNNLRKQYPQLTIVLDFPIPRHLYDTSTYYISAIWNENTLTLSRNQS